jgi:N-acetylmuramoyl-L-alanine amidase
VVIDPGHNGANAAHPAQMNRLVDAGGFRKACNTTGTATNAGYPEHAFAWDTAQRLAAALRARGATVVLTRPNDSGWGPCIDQRGLTAARNHADLLISIHGDGAASAAHGFHVIYPGLVRGYTDRTSAPSGRAARAVRDALVRAGLRPATYVAGGDGLMSRTDLGTLNRAGTPAVMVECGNMRNSGDARLMSTPTGRAEIAAALLGGVTAWLR